MMIFTKKKWTLLFSKKKFLHFSACIHCLSRCVAILNYKIRFFHISIRQCIARDFLVKDFLETVSFNSSYVNYYLLTLFVIKIAFQRPGSGLRPIKAEQGMVPVFILIKNVCICIKQKIFWNKSKKKKINKLNKEMQDSRIRHGYKERSDHMICLFPFFKIKSFFKKFFKDFELTSIHKI